MSTPCIPVNEFSVNHLPSAERFAMWQKNLSQAYDVSLLDTVTSGDFKGNISTFFLDQIIVASTKSVSQIYSRSTASIAASDFDHVIIEIIWSGNRRIKTFSRDVDAFAGDIMVFNARKEYSQEIEATEAIGIDGDQLFYRDTSVVIPRALLAPWEAIIDNLHAYKLTADSAAAIAIRGLVSNILESADKIPQVMAATYAGALVELAFGSIAACDPDIAQSSQKQHTRLAKLKAAVYQSIDKHLDNPDLDVQHLADDLHMSRSTLYRQCKAWGGVGSLIRQRRLTKAHTLLRTSGVEGVSITDISQRVGFSSVNAFSRAYKAHFSVSPKETVAVQLTGSQNLETNADKLTYMEGLLLHL